MLRRPDDVKEWRKPQDESVDEPQETTVAAEPEVEPEVPTEVKPVKKAPARRKKKAEQAE